MLAVTLPRSRGVMMRRRYGDGPVPADSRLHDTGEWDPESVLRRRRPAFHTPWLPNCVLGDNSKLRNDLRPKRNHPDEQRDRGLRGGFFNKDLQLRDLLSWNTART